MTLLFFFSSRSCSDSFDRTALTAAINASALSTVSCAAATVAATSLRLEILGTNADWARGGLNDVTGGAGTRGVAEETAEAVAAGNDPVFVSAGTTILAAAADKGKDGLAVAEMTTGAEGGGGGV